MIVELPSPSELDPRDFETFCELFCEIWGIGWSGLRRSETGFPAPQAPAPSFLELGGYTGSPVLPCKTRIVWLKSPTQGTVQSVRAFSTQYAISSATRCSKPGDRIRVNQKIPIPRDLPNRGALSNSPVGFPTRAGRGVLQNHPSK